jgi:hypothetical protein
VPTRTKRALSEGRAEYEDEARVVGDRDAVALDGRAPHRGGVEEQVDEVVVEQVDLVDVEEAAVGLGEQAGLVLRATLRQCALEVQRAEDPVLGGADGQLDEADRTGLGGCVGGVRAAVGVRRRAPGCDREPVARDDVDGRQHGGERAHDRRLGRALLAAHEDAADLGRDGRQHQGQRHVSGVDDGGEGVVLWHRGSRSLAMDRSLEAGLRTSRIVMLDVRITAAGLCRNLTGFPDSPHGSGHLGAVPSR